MKDFNPLLQMASGVHFSFFGSFHYGTIGFPLSDEPPQKIANDVARGVLGPSQLGFSDSRRLQKRIN